MSNTQRVDKTLFEGSHYLGKPADHTDLLVRRRIEILKGFTKFWDANATVLDIGCGNGNTILQVAAAFKRAYGLEYAPDHESEFHQLKENLNAHNAEWVQHDISKAAFSPAVDRLISFEVIEHLPTEEAVLNYAASLREGGLFAISVPNKWWIFETHGASLPLLPWNRVPFFSWLPRPIHERWALARIYTKGRIKQLLESSGLEVMEMHYVTAPMDVVKWKPLQTLLRKYIFGNNTTVWPFKAVSIMVFGRKKA
jgi:2-polyprenyl-3-methyl-5-hydroxy-6-metoxy-1,4-benzoquinol methylase